LLDPARLSDLTGHHFVQLTVPATGPREQLTLLHWFVEHHAHIGNIVVATDSRWCTQDASLPITDAFPFWLYADDNAEYAAGALRTAALDRGWRRLLVVLGRRKPSDPGGYWDYEHGRVWGFGQFAGAIPNGFNPGVEMRAPQRPFPAIERLQASVATLPADAGIALVYPPVFATELPAAGSTAAELLAECKGALSQVAHARGTFLDFAVDGEIARNPKNFMDATHYRADVARTMEAQIAAALAQTRP
jgi:hypothetical protein